MVPEENHPLCDYSEEEKVAYLSVVASMASADGTVTDEEITHLRNLWTEVGLGQRDRGTVIAFAEDPSSSALDEHLAALKSSELRFSLLTDVLFAAHAHGGVEPGEEEHVKTIAQALGIRDDQIVAMRRYVDAVIAAADAGDPKLEWKKVGGAAAAQLAGAGVPIGAVAVSGSVFGLSAAGITSGLAALGMGFGMVSGLGVAVGIGVGSYMGVRWLYKKIVGV